MKNGLNNSQRKAVDWVSTCLTKKFDAQGVIPKDSPRKERVVGTIDMTPPREKRVVVGEGKKAKVYRRIRVYK